MKTRTFRTVCTFALTMAVAAAITLRPRPLTAQTVPTGTIRSPYTTNCLQPLNGSAGGAVAIVLMPCDGSPAQQWQRILAEYQGWNFRNQLSGLCLQAAGGRANHTPVLQAACGDYAGALWSYDAPPGPAMQLYSGLPNSSNFCLDIPGGQKTPGIPLQIYACNGTVSQDWIYSGLFTSGVVRSGASNLCLEPANESAAAGAPIVQQKCAELGTPAQTWTLVSNYGSRNYYVNQLSGFCIDAIGNGTPKNHDPVVQWPCSNISNEVWTYQPVSSGIGGSIHSAKAKTSGFCLDVPGGLATPGLAVQIYQCNQTAAQNWF